ncbi:transposase, partial [Mesorhizobium sp. PL10]
MAAVGDIERFSSPEKLVSYFGLNPRVRQSGDKPAYHGRITKQGRTHARSMLVEAAWVISGVPGPLRAFFMRIRDKRGKHVAAVATAQQAGSHCVAHADQERGLYLDPPGAPGLEAPKTGIDRRLSVSPRRQEQGIRRRLQQQVGPRQRA